MIPANLMARRKEEERLERAQAMVRDRDRVSGIVTFEHRTDAKIADRLVRDRIAAENKKLRARVDERRARLASLLEVEKREQEREIEATFESAEQVKEK